MSNPNPSPATRFQPGNQAARVKGKNMRDAFAADWEEHGEAILQRLRDEDIGTYVRVAASLLPKEIVATLKHEVSDGITADQRALLKPVLPLLARLFADVPVPEALETLEQIIRAHLAKPALPPIPPVGAR